MCSVELQLCEEFPIVDAVSVSVFFLNWTVVSYFSTRKFV